MQERKRKATRQRRLANDNLRARRCPADRNIPPSHPRNTSPYRAYVIPDLTADVLATQPYPSPSSHQHFQPLRSLKICVEITYQYLSTVPMTKSITNCDHHGPTCLACGFGTPTAMSCCTGHSRYAMQRAAMRCDAMQVGVKAAIRIEDEVKS